jgi:hypothetical protein
MKKIKSVLPIVLAMIVIACAIVAFGGCKKSGDIQVTAVGVMSSYEGCKQSVAEPLSGAADTIAPGADDCIQFEYDGNGTLILTHINAGFNCCPGQISADIQINGNLITVTEMESEAGCHCLCLFDVHYRFSNLSPGAYTFTFVEPYMNTGDQPLEFTVTLSAAGIDVQCIERNYYPWSQ